VDRLEDGRLAIIDYKTGAARGFLNREGEPGDWQLVVYADALDEPVGALGLLNLDSRTIAYRGAGGEWTPVDNWDETLERWRKVVHRALREFGRGDVRINTRQSISDGRQLSNCFTPISGPGKMRSTYPAPSSCRHRRGQARPRC
jgi:hypothetical protein